MAGLLFLLFAVHAIAQSIVVREAIPILVSEDGRAGTGVVVEGGDILTAAHVAQTSVEARFHSGFRARAHSVCRGSGDVAVLQTDRPRAIPSYEISFRVPAHGEELVIAGYPRGRWTVVTVQALNTHKVPASDTSTIIIGLTTTHPGIDTRGMSGAPLIDREGKVVAIHYAHVKNDRLLAFPLEEALGACRERLQNSNRGSCTPVIDGARIRCD